MTAEWTKDDDRMLELNNGTLEAASTRLSFAVSEARREMAKTIRVTRPWKWLFDYLERKQ